MPLDLKFIRENYELIHKDLEKRQQPEKLPLLESLLKEDREWRSLKAETDTLKQRRNRITEEIKIAKAQGKKIDRLLKEAKKIPDQIKQNDKKILMLQGSIHEKQFQIPNILDKAVPMGASEEDNTTLWEWGKKPAYPFKPQSHVDMLENLAIGDIPRAAKTSGARFYFLKGALVLLDYAILRFAMDLLHKKNYALIEPPYMLRRKPYEGATALSDFEDMLYKIEDEDLYLIATSEHSIVAMHMDEILDAKELPLKYAGISPCFRKEAGAHGKDTKGIFRVHQFHKVEQFIFCEPEQSCELHEELIKNAEEIFQKLELPYRIVDVCTGDIGTVAARKYDLETWMPAQNTYREVVSCSNCTEYQAAGLNIRYKTPNGKNRYVNTINSTALATPRTLVAIMENFQNEDGSFNIPKVLHPYMNGIKKIPPKK